MQFQITPFFSDHPAQQLGHPHDIQLWNVSVPKIADRSAIEKWGMQFLAEIERLEAALAESERLHRQDIEHIGAKMIAEANRRDWCEIYDDVVDDLNNQLHVELPVREHDYSVELTYQVRVTATMTARDADAALGIAKKIAPRELDCGFLIGETGDDNKSRHAWSMVDADIVDSYVEMD